IPLPGVGVGANGLRGTCAGDVDGDGRDDLALCFDAGVAVFLARGSRLSPVVLWISAGVGALVAATILDANADGSADVMAYAAHNKGFVLLPFWALTNAFGTPHAASAPQDPAWQGPGPLGLNVFTADVDNDQDE